VNWFIEKYPNWKKEYEEIQQYHDGLHDVPMVNKYFFIHNFNTLRAFSDVPQNTIDYNIKLLKSSR